MSEQVYVPKVKTGHVVLETPLAHVKDHLSLVKGTLVKFPLVHSFIQQCFFSRSDICSMTRTFNWWEGLCWRTWLERIEPHPAHFYLRYCFSDTFFQSWSPIPCWSYPPSLEERQHVGAGAPGKFISWFWSFNYTDLYSIVLSVSSKHYLRLPITQSDWSLTQELNSEHPNKHPYKTSTITNYFPALFKHSFGPRSIPPTIANTASKFPHNITSSPPSSHPQSFFHVGKKSSSQGRINIMDLTDSLDIFFDVLIYFSMAWYYGHFLWHA